MNCQVPLAGTIEFKLVEFFRAGIVLDMKETGPGVEDKIQILRQVVFGLTTKAVNEYVFALDTLLPLILERVVSKFYSLLVFLRAELSSYERLQVRLNVAECLLTGFPRSTLNSDP